MVKQFLLVIYPDDLRLRSTQETREWLKQHSQEFCCDDCHCSVTLPREIDVQTWEEWKRQLTPRYLFETDLLKKIDAEITEKPGRVVDVGPLLCPYCGKPFGQKSVLSPKCAKCGSRDMEQTDFALASLRYGIEWPPQPPIARCDIDI